MTEPVNERIVANVRSRMAAAFSTAVRSAQIATWQPKDLVVVVSHGDPVPNAELSYPGNPPVIAYDMPVIVAGIVKPSDDETTAIDTFKNRMGADIIAAATNAANWHQWGSLAINTTLGPIESYTEETGGRCGVMVTLLVTYRVPENDPTTVSA
jgi:hypothetical protein